MPTYFVMGKKNKKYYINLNQFMNWYYIDRNNIKVKYMNVVEDLLKGVVMSTPIKLTFVYYARDNRVRDRANACCVHEKFFCDGLVQAGCIEDDNDKFIIETKYLSGGVDRANPRMEIIVEEV